MKVFDWDKAARIIADSKAEEAFAGLAEDWEFTYGRIYRDGHVVLDDYTFLASDWATPTLICGGMDYECFREDDETPGWNEKTKWPGSALAILAGAEE